MILMNIQGLTIDLTTKIPILILKDPISKRVLPIWIGLLEATAIASELGKISFSRPMTHDLLYNVISQLDYLIIKVEVATLKENTFYGLIHLAGAKGSIIIDSRPSDAIALALRASAPIFVDQSILETAGIIEGKAEYNNDDIEQKWKDLLNMMRPEDFGKYKM